MATVASSVSWAIRAASSADIFVVASATGCYALQLSITCIAKFQPGSRLWNYHELAWVPSLDVSDSDGIRFRGGFLPTCSHRPNQPKTNNSLQKSWPCWLSFDLRYLRHPLNIFPWKSLWNHHIFYFGCQDSPLCTHRCIDLRPSVLRPSCQGLCVPAGLWSRWSVPLKMVCIPPICGCFNRDTMG